MVYNIETSVERKIVREKPKENNNREEKGDNKDGWLSVVSAPAWYSSALCWNLDISQKYKMGDVSKGVANTR